MDAVKYGSNNENLGMEIPGLRISKNVPNAVAEKKKEPETDENSHPTIPKYVKDTRKSSSGRIVTQTYVRGSYLGKGGFASCYTFLSLPSCKKFAGKVINKESLNRARSKAKLIGEIKIHRSLRHRHIVGFETFFEDDTNVYLILQLCRRETLFDMIHKRKRITEPEAALLMLQIICATRYLHANLIIHRDLKLGNIFLDEGMGVCIGDFGLAAEATSTDCRRRTICGTPNYIAPEILASASRANKHSDALKLNPNAEAPPDEGHSFPVDVWAIGVIFYSLLVGRPPFETNHVQETYSRISKVEFSYPPDIPISPAARSLINSILVKDPKKRPTLEEIAAHPFFTASGTYIPSALPANVVSEVPRFDRHQMLPGVFVVEKILGAPVHGLIERQPDGTKILRSEPRTEVRKLNLPLDGHVGLRENLTKYETLYERRFEIAKHTYDASADQSKHARSRRGTVASPQDLENYAKTVDMEKKRSVGSTNSTPLQNSPHSTPLAHKQDNGSTSDYRMNKSRTVDAAHIWHGSTGQETPSDQGMQSSKPWLRSLQSSVTSSGVLSSVDSKSSGQTPFSRKDSAGELHAKNQPVQPREIYPTSSAPVEPRKALQSLQQRSNQAEWNNRPVSSYKQAPQPVASSHELAPTPTHPSEMAHHVAKTSSAHAVDRYNMYSREGLSPSTEQDYKVMHARVSPNPTLYPQQPVRQLPQGAEMEAKRQETITPSRQELVSPQLRLSSSSQLTQGQQQPLQSRKKEPLDSRRERTKLNRQNFIHEQELCTLNCYQRPFMIFGETNETLLDVYNILCTCDQEEPNANVVRPIMPFVTSWIDYTSKYGLGWMLSNGVTGVLFNDGTKIAVESPSSDSDGKFQYIDRLPLHIQSRMSKTPPPRDGIVDDCNFLRRLGTFKDFPEDLHKKRSLAIQYRQHFLHRYQSRYNLRKNKTIAVEILNNVQQFVGGIETVQPAPTAVGPIEEEFINMGCKDEYYPYVKKWSRSKHAVIFRLSNGCVQTSFFDGPNVVFCPAEDSVTYIDQSGNGFATSFANAFRYSEALETICKNANVAIIDALKKTNYARDAMYQILDRVIQERRDIEE